MLIFGYSKQSPSIKEKFKNSAYVPIAFIVLVGVMIPLSYYYYYFYFKLESKKQCKYITVGASETTENHLLQFLHLYVTWKTNEKALMATKIIPVVPEEINETLSELFQTTSISTFGKNCQNTVFDTVLDVNILPNTLSEVSYELQDWVHTYPELILYSLKNVKKELHFRRELRREIKTILGRITLKLDTNPIFICMHYRGINNVEQINMYALYNPPPTHKYYILAMEYFKNKYENVVFLLISTDGSWLIQYSMMIGSHGYVIVNPIKYNDTNKNFVLMALCNHNVISTGIFATNAALFANGETIVYAEYTSGSKIIDSADGLTVAKYMQDKWLLGNNTYIGNYSDFYI